MPTPDIYGMLGAFIASAPDANTTPVPTELQMPATDGTAPESVEPAGAIGGVTTTSDAALNAAANMTQGKRAALSASAAATGVLNQAQAQSDKAADSEAALQGDIATAQAPIFAEHEAQIKQHEAQMLTMLPKYQAEATKQFDEYIRASDDFAKTRVYNWWGEASTGAKSLGIISQFMAGALQGLTGNIGASTPMDRVIENDLQLQKANLGKKAETVSMKRGVYADLMARFKDEKIADEAFRHAAWTSTLQRADAMIRSMPELQRRQAEVGAQKLKADAALRLASSKSAIQEHLGDQAQQQAFKASDLGLSLAGLSQQDAAAANTLNGGKPLAGVPDVDGSELLPEKEQGEIRMAVKATNEIQTISDKVVALARRNLSVNARNRELQQLRDSYIFQVKNQEQLGALSEGDLDLAVKSAGRTFDSNIYKIFNMTSEKDRSASAAQLGIDAQQRLDRNLKTYVNPATRQPLVYRRAQ